MKLRELPLEAAVGALRMFGIVVALRLPVSFYSGILAGLQRMDVGSLLDAVEATAARRKRPA